MQRARSPSTDIAPILFDNCASCHRPIDGAAPQLGRRSASREGGPAATSGSFDDPICVAGAPFSVLDYDSVRGHARAIASAVQRRAMPPWLPEPGHAAFANERRLRDDQIALIAKWVGSGAPEGNPADAPKPPTSSGGWQLGTPDLVLTLPFPDARAWFEQALEFCASLPESASTLEQAFEIRLELQPVLIALGEVRRALEALREAETLAERLKSIDTQRPQPTQL